MNKAPDTRNKLDSNVGIKKRKKKENKFSMSEFKEVAPLVKLGISPRTGNRKLVKLSNGQLFKEAHGFSKTMKRLMKKYGVETLEGYKLLRRERKLAAKKAKRKPISNSKVAEPTKAKKKK